MTFLNVSGIHLFSQTHSRGFLSRILYERRLNNQKWEKGTRDFTSMYISGLFKSLNRIHGTKDSWLNRKSLLYKHENLCEINSQEKKYWAPKIHTACSTRGFLQTHLGLYNEVRSQRLFCQKIVRESISQNKDMYRSEFSTYSSFSSLYGWSDGLSRDVKLIWFRMKLGSNQYWNLIKNIRHEFKTYVNRIVERALWTPEKIKCIAEFSFSQSKVIGNRSFVEKLLRSISSLVLLHVSQWNRLRYVRGLDCATNLYLRIDWT